MSTGLHICRCFNIGSKIIAMASISIGIPKNKWLISFFVWKFHMSAPTPCWNSKPITELANGKAQCNMNSGLTVKLPRGCCPLVLKKWTTKILQWPCLSGSLGINRLRKLRGLHIESSLWMLHIITPCFTYYKFHTRFLCGWSFDSKREISDNVSISNYWKTILSLNIAHVQNIFTTNDL